MAGSWAELVVFAVGGSRLALPLANVCRAVRAAEITPLPGAPGFIRGVVDVQGDVTPVVGMRERMGLPQKPLSPDDEFLLVRARTRALALLIDKVEGVITAATQGLPDARISGPAGDTLQGLAQLPDGLVLVQDLDRFLSPPEDQQLHRAMESAA